VALRLGLLTGNHAPAVKPLFHGYSFTVLGWKRHEPRVILSRAIFGVVVAPTLAETVSDALAAPDAVGATWANGVLKCVKRLCFTVVAHCYFFLKMKGGSSPSLFTRFALSRTIPG
jgi:hypothetical protein